MKKSIGPTLMQAHLALALLLVATLGIAPQAQATLPTMSLQERTGELSTSAAPTLTEQLDAAHAQLRQAMDQRDKQAAQNPGRYRQDLALDKQRLLDWLVDLQREKAKHIEELIALRNTGATTVDNDPLLKALQGSSPYSALQVDALRDEIDGLKQKLTAADATFHANQTEMQNLHDQLKARDAAVTRSNARRLCKP